MSRRALIVDVLFGLMPHEEAIDSQRLSIIGQAQQNPLALIRSTHSGWRPGNLATVYLAISTLDHTCRSLSLLQLTEQRWRLDTFPLRQLRHNTKSSRTDLYEEKGRQGSSISGFREKVVE